MKLFKRFLFAKWIFNKPRKNDILIYDRESEWIARFLFSKKSYEILDVRYESINIYIFYITFLKVGIKNFVQNYKKNFMKLVSPKIVFTAMDNYLAFYKLKNIYDKPFYISVQNGMRNYEFYNECKKYIQKTTAKLKADHIFFFGKNEKERCSKIIEGNIHCSGSLLNNHYLISARKVKKKISSIMYISQYSVASHDQASTFAKNSFKKDIRIFNYLIRFCEKKNIKLSFCAKVATSLETFYRNKLNKGNWIYRPKVSEFKTYKTLNKQQMIVFRYSTLGFEALAKGIKCVASSEHFPIRGSNVNYPKSGLFWTNSKNYDDLEKTLNRVIGFSNKRWKKIVDKYSTEILSYDPTNTKIKKILKNILKKNTNKLKTNKQTLKYMRST